MDPGHRLDAGGSEVGIQLLNIYSRGFSFSAVVEGLTCYWNASQRELSDTAWATVQEKDIPAIRSSIGGTRNPLHLQRFLECSHAEALPSSIWDQTRL
jgi:hypothetical protein